MGLLSNVLPRMSSGNWSSISAIAGLILAAIGIGGLLHEYAQGKAVGCTQPYYAPGYSPDDPRPALQSTARSQTKPQPFQPLYKDLDCQRPDGAKDYELCQQWRAANAGQEQACIAGLQFWIGVLGAYVGALGLLGLLATVIYTALSAKAAAVAASTAEQSLIVLNRPFVFMPGFDLTAIIAEKDRVLGYHLSAKFSNAGGTVARRALIRLNVQRHPPGDLPANFVFGDFPDARMPHLTIIGPKETVLSTASAIRVNEFTATWRRTQSIFIWGYVEYDDIFGSPRHRTEFCAKVVVVGDPNRPDNVGAIQFNNYGSYNASDADCRYQPGLTPTIQPAPGPPIAGAVL